MVSIEYTPSDRYWDKLGDLFIWSAMAFDSSNNYTVYNDQPLAVGLTSNDMVTCFSEEYEYDEAGEWYLDLILTNHQLARSCVWCNRWWVLCKSTDEDVSFNGIDITAKTIINPDGSIVQPSDNFNNNYNNYDAMKLELTLHLEMIMLI